VVVLGLAWLVPAPSPVAATPQVPVQAPFAEVANDLDLGVVIPALQGAFGERYGGYWLERKRNHDVMHVGVVGAGDADRAAVASLTGGHPRVVTDNVAQSYDTLAAAKDEIAASLDPAAGNFSVEVDLPTNSVVVHTADDGAAAAATAPEAARRGAARAHANARRQGQPPGQVQGQSQAPPVDPASAVRLEPESSIAVKPLGVGTRDAFPPFEAGLGVWVAFGSYWVRCTTGWMFWNQWYGYFGSTAGHCSHLGDGVVMGNYIVGGMRANTYQSWATVWGDVSFFSLSDGGWPGWAVVHQEQTHYAVNQKYSNAQLGNGLSLCFEGITSRSDNCGPIVRSNQTICCDGAGHTYIYTCIAYPPQAGDSGGPVYRVRGDLTAAVAGMLSSAVTINGSTAMCFSTIQNIEAATFSQLVMG
jgi:hypothetical protein